MNTASGTYPPNCYVSATGVTKKTVSHILNEARELFTRIGKRLGQRAIYFEVREGGEIIDLE
jgi:hypothetical protein